MRDTVRAGEGEREQKDSKGHRERERGSAETEGANGGVPKTECVRNKR